MGIYSEFLDMKFSFPGLTKERKKYLQEISSLRNGNDILTYAADLNQNDPRISIIYEDILAIKDQLDNLSGIALDVVLETPGGLGEIAEDIVKMFRNKYKQVNFIIPGCAKSAGTIMAMSGDEILMEPCSALGPIDAQLRWRDKTISADAFLKGFESIKNEIEEKGILNKAYVPILSNISPGELEHAENALNFAQKLVSEWLINYKFKNWTTHSSTGKQVTDKDKKSRALNIAKALSNQKLWKTHGRSIKIDDLEKLRLLITNYSKDEKLYNAISKYYTALRISMDTTNIYKIIETPISQIYRFKIPPTERRLPPTNQPAKAAIVEVRCLNCGNIQKLQANFEQNVDLEEGISSFPPDNQLKCANCGSIMNLKDLRLQLESESKRRIL